MSRQFLRVALGLSVCAASSASYGAAISEWVGPLVETAYGEFYEMRNATYERYTYPYVSASLVILTDRDNNANDGDRWSVEIRNANGGSMGVAELLYSRTTDCIEFQGYPVSCGWYIPPEDHGYMWGYITVRYHARCYDHADHQLVAIYPDAATSTRPFTTTRFRPRIDAVSVAPQIEPYSDRIDTDGAGSAIVEVYVKDELGCGVSLGGVSVELDNTLVPRSGGHANFAVEDHTTGRYSPIASYGGTVSNQNEEVIKHHNPRDPANPYQEIYTAVSTIKGETDEGGIYAAEFKGGAFGIKETIEITASIDHVSEQDPAAEDLFATEVSLGFAGLTEVPVNSQANYTFAFGDGCGMFEPDARWATPELKEKILELALNWRDFYGDKLSLNDISLPLGGLIEKNTRNEGCHRSHRLGLDFDVNYNLNKLGECTSVGADSYCRKDDLYAIAELIGLTAPVSSGVHFRLE